MKQKENEKITTYNPQEIEPHWQEVWEREKIFSPDMDKAENPFYNLMMFPYPSAEGLHVGNMYAFTGADVHARYMRMKGRDVFEPIGLDGFGIHSENYAIKVGTHPKEQSEKSGANFYRQLKTIGNSFDWTRTLETYDPEYYRWTQWLFIELFKNGLAERKKAEVNYCPNCRTVLADEQVIDGHCERCGHKVEKRALEQWFFKITEYADRLLENIDELNWSARVKIAQRNWIGKSEGAIIRFKIQDLGIKNEEVEVFTTRPDTLHGVTYLSISPELAKIWMDSGWGASDEVRQYVEDSLKKRRQGNVEKDKSGIDAGIYAVNPVNGERVPVWIADYVLSGYGTGVVMGVPAHDKRDFEFANEHELPIKQVVSVDGEHDQEGKLYEDEVGKLVSSGKYTGLAVAEAQKKMLHDGIGKNHSQYHLRDWLISRQRYWGPPIPMIYCERCAESIKNKEVSIKNKTKGEILNPGWIPVPEDQLPVRLPDVKDFQPKGDGLSPLANIPEFVKTTCPECGGEARRETDVSDTFLDSSWYFLRYTSTEKEEVAFHPERTKKWLPVDIYIGGAEHSVLHLLYARFVTMALHDMGYLSFEEPFTKFYAHGLLIKDGAKMSKSKGNVIVPDEYIGKYGADAFRMYLRFLGPFDQGGDFSDEGIEGMSRFIKRVYRLLSKTPISSGEFLNSKNRQRQVWMHKTIKRVGDDTEALRYNTAISGMMEYYNFLSDQKELYEEEWETFLKLLAPYAPYMTEELWQRFKGRDPGFKIQDLGEEFQSIHQEAWPTFDPGMLVENEVTVIIQVNGKRRGEISVSSDKINEKEHLEKLAKDSAERYFKNSDILKVIHVPGRIVNFVVRYG